ncbi:sucrase/ferredoxin family protein [Trifolium repens]|nr:sucrase/ferredoxin family protein [Trifolium repens]
MVCSHVGGNLITFSPGPDGKIMGHWYGYVTPNDVPALLDQHIAKGQIIQKLWRLPLLIISKALWGHLTESFEQNKVVDETAVAHKFYIGYKFYNKSG